MSPAPRGLRGRATEEQLVKNRRLVGVINTFWENKGKVADARVVLKRINIKYFKTRTESKLLSKPLLVPSYEIISNVGQLCVHNT